MKDQEKVKKAKRRIEEYVEKKIIEKENVDEDKKDDIKKDVDEDMQDDNDYKQDANEDHKIYQLIQCACEVSRNGRGTTWMMRIGLDVESGSKGTTSGVRNGRRRMTSWSGWRGSS